MIYIPNGQTGTQIYDDPEPETIDLNITTGYKTTSTVSSTQQSTTETSPTITPAPDAENTVSPVPPTIEDEENYFSEPEANVVKSAPIDTVIFIDERLNEELITDLLFEDIAGQELLSIARNDSVNGQNIIYQPIKNLNILNETYSAENLLKIQETSNRYFNNFVINLREKMPNYEDTKNYYIEESTGNLIIELINMRSDEQVEIQISTNAIIDEIGI